jgi:hypothetical protein
VVLGLVSPADVGLVTGAVCFSSCDVGGMRGLGLVSRAACFTSCA